MKKTINRKNIKNKYAKSSQTTIARNGMNLNEWSASDVSNAKYVGIIEFEDNQGEFHNFEIMETEDRLVFGGMTNSGFIESGYIEKDGRSSDETLANLLEDLEVYYNDGEQHVSEIVVNQRMAKGGETRMARRGMKVDNSTENRQYWFNQIVQGGFMEQLSKFQEVYENSLLCEPLDADYKAQWRKEYVDKLLRLSKDVDFVYYELVKTDISIEDSEPSNAKELASQKKYVNRIKKLLTKLSNTLNETYAEISTNLGSISTEDGQEFDMDYYQEIQDLVDEHLSYIEEYNNSFDEKFANGGGVDDLDKKILSIQKKISELETKQADYWGSSEAKMVQGSPYDNQLSELYEELRQIKENKTTKYSIGKVSGNDEKAQKKMAFEFYKLLRESYSSSDKNLKSYSKFLNSLTTDLQQKTWDKLQYKTYQDKWGYKVMVNKSKDTIKMLMKKENGGETSMARDGMKVTRDMGDYFEVNDYSSGKTLYIFALTEKEAEEISEEIDFDAYENGDYVSNYDVDVTEMANGGKFAEGGKFMRGGIAGDVYSLQNPEQFKQLITIYNDLSEKTNLIKGYYLDHTDNSIVFLTTPNISDIGKDEIYGYVESLRSKGFSIINFKKTINTEKYENGLSWGTEKGGMIKQSGIDGRANPQWFKLFLIDRIKYDKGGSIAEGNYHMILSQAKQVKHHVDELQDILKKEDDIEAWVVAKMQDVSSNLSDVTHYLDGKSDMPMAKHGMKVKSDRLPTYTIKVDFLDKEDSNFYYNSMEEVFEFVGESATDSQMDKFEEEGYDIDHIFGGEYSTKLVSEIYIPRDERIKSKIVSYLNDKFGKGEVKVSVQESSDINTKMAKRGMKVGNSSWSIGEDLGHLPNKYYFLYNSSTGERKGFFSTKKEAMEKMEKLGYYAKGGETSMARRGMKVDKPSVTLTKSEINKFKRLSSNLEKANEEFVELKESCIDDTYDLETKSSIALSDLDEFYYSLLEKYGDTKETRDVISNIKYAKGGEVEMAKHGMKVKSDRLPTYTIKVDFVDKKDSNFYYNSMEEVFEFVGESATDSQMDKFEEEGYDIDHIFGGEYSTKLVSEIYIPRDERIKSKIVSYLNDKFGKGEVKVSVQESSDINTKMAKDGMKVEKIEYPTITLKEYDLNDDQAEIFAYIETRQELQSQYDAIRKNLMTKIARGQFDEKKAPKLFVYLVENGLKLYSKNFGEIKLSKQEKEEIANNMVVDFMSEAELGNYENETFLPKKYLAEDGMFIMSYDIYNEEGDLIESGLEAQDVVAYANMVWYYDMMDEDGEEIDDVDVAIDFLEQSEFNVERNNPKKSSFATKKRKIIRKIKK